MGTTKKYLDFLFTGTPVSLVWQRKPYRRNCRGCSPQENGTKYHAALPFFFFVF